MATHAPPRGIPAANTTSGDPPATSATATGSSTSGGTPLDPKRFPHPPVMSAVSGSQTPTNVNSGRGSNAAIGGLLSGSGGMCSPSINTSNLPAFNLGNVVMNLNRVPVKHGVVVPRVGGVLTLDVAKDEGEAFTGGSNIDPPLLMPLFTNQRHPLKYSAVESFLTLLREGLEFKLTSPMKNPTLLHFLNGFVDSATALNSMGWILSSRFLTPPGLLKSSLPRIGVLLSLLLLSHGLIV